MNLKTVCEKNGWATDHNGRPTHALTLAVDAAEHVLDEVERRYLDAAKACVGKGHNIEAAYVKRLTAVILRIMRQEVWG